MKCRYLFIAAALTGALLVGGCSEQERREIREKEIRIAAEQAKQQRILNQYVADLSAETQRQENAHDAATEREFNENLTLLGRVIAFLAAIGGVIGFAIHSVRRLGEKIAVERTARHAQNLKAIEADPNLTPQQRENLFRAAIEAANQAGTPLIGYSPNTGGTT
tara:strand:+ start:46 stop:537 length:492 start_codon:yes stop_codon:yes gene_type:complete